ncbi:type II secretion system protein GspG [Sediminibacter sp. Hel_I_10]|uniref:type II secretion system protein GspG n=1 Tax=Sediminibacter sp. Hel_I_10 TaxID=1392490 RepID=UPI00047E81C0|nr:type II secretion system protein GspG [Sediminibacter sp. Hel_I_10]
MTEFLASLLAEFGLIYEDVKHRKRIQQKEKEDGRKRPLQLILLQPSVIILIVVFVLVSLVVFLFYVYQSRYIFPEKTRAEMIEMSARLENWHENTGHYPSNLNELIGNSPVRQEWRKDAWKRPYKYIINHNGQGFEITSSGADGTFGTKDDIKSK